jgi:hypothetical protein
VNALSFQFVFGSGYQLLGVPLPSVVRVYRQPIDPAFPSIVGDDDNADELIVLFESQYLLQTRRSVELTGEFFAAVAPPWP